jgi:hypothetical protein
MRTTVTEEEDACIFTSTFSLSLKFLGNVTGGILKLSHLNFRIVLPALIKFTSQAADRTSSRLKHRRSRMARHKINGRFSLLKVRLFLDTGSVKVSI